MGKNARLYWIHALTPLHVGAGRGVGYIDLPIVREKVTNWPLVPGSAVKGVLRDHYAGTPSVDLAFGKGGDENANAGSLVFSDARIVCLPVRSLYGTFAWCASPLSLKRLKRDLAVVNAQLDDVSVAAGKCRVTGESALMNADQKVYLEDLDLDVEPQRVDSVAKVIAQAVFAADANWSAQFKKRFAILADDVFDFLCETGTEVHARVRIEDEKKTVASGALWYEESLPAETILGGLVWCDRIYGNNSLKPEQILGDYCKNVDLQIGGKATVGHGRVRLVFSNGGN